MSTRQHNIPSPIAKAAVQTCVQIVHTICRFRILSVLLTRSAQAGRQHLRAPRTVLRRRSSSFSDSGWLTALSASNRKARDNRPVDDAPRTAQSQQLSAHNLAEVKVRCPRSCYGALRAER